MVLETYEIGGSNPQFWKGEFTHTPQYAVVAVLRGRPRRDAAVRAPAAAARVSSGPTRRRGFVVLRATSARCGCPPFVAFVIVAILFVLGLLCCTGGSRTRWRPEKAKAGPVAVPARDDSELAKV